MAEAREEADESAHWYDARRAGLGDEFLSVLGTAFNAIEADPRRFEKLATRRAQRDVRRCNLERFPFTVVFECRDDEVVVLAIAHAKRRPGYWRRRME
jgi:hypothetical protein